MKLSRQFYAFARTWLVAGRYALEQGRPDEACRAFLEADRARAAARLVRSPR